MFGAAKPKIKIRELIGAKSGLPPRNPFYKNPELYPSGDAAFKPKSAQQWGQHFKNTLSQNVSSMPEIPLFQSPNRGGLINYDRNNAYSSANKWQRTPKSGAQYGLANIPASGSHIEVYDDQIGAEANDE